MLCKQAPFCAGKRTSCVDRSSRSDPNSAMDEVPCRIETGAMQLTSHDTMVYPPLFFSSF